MVEPDKVTLDVVPTTGTIDGADTTGSDEIPVVPVFIRSRLTPEAADDLLAFKAERVVRSLGVTGSVGGTGSIGLPVTTGLDFSYVYSYHYFHF